MAFIKNYHLRISDRKGTPNLEYVPSWDNFCSTPNAVDRLVREIRYQIKQGVRPIAVVFVPKRRKQRDD